MVGLLVCAVIALVFAVGRSAGGAASCDGAVDAQSIFAAGSGPTSPAANPRMDPTVVFGPGERLALVAIDTVVPERAPRILWFVEGGERPGFGSPPERPPRVSA